MAVKYLFAHFVINLVRLIPWKSYIIHEQHLRYKRYCIKHYFRVPLVPINKYGEKFEKIRTMFTKSNKNKPGRKVFFIS